MRGATAVHLNLLAVSMGPAKKRRTGESGGFLACRGRINQCKSVAETGWNGEVTDVCIDIRARVLVRKGSKGCM